MKNYFTLLCVFIQLTTSFAQSLTLPSGKDITVKEDSLNGKPYTLKFKLLDRSPGSTTTIKIIDGDDGTASKGTDYDYQTVRELDVKTFSEGVRQEFEIRFTVKPDLIPESQEYFNLYLTYDRRGVSVTDKLRITIDDATTIEKQKSEIDTAKWSVRLITGGSFDFFDAPVFKNFAGELKLFIPGLTKKKLFSKTRSIGFQAGLFNYRYYESDSSNGNIQSEKYLLNSTERTLRVDTTQYVNDVYALNAVTNYNNWGIYFNPMIKLDGNSFFDLYMELHVEGIWRTRQTSFKKAPIRKDTLRLNRSDVAQGNVFQATPRIRAAYTEDNYFDFYMGIGLPLKVNIKDAFEFYFAPTLGLTTFTTLRFDRVEENKISRVITTEINKPTYFMLSKFQLTTKVAPVDLVLGGEIRYIHRKQIDRNRVYKALYLGAVIPLDKWKK